MTVPVTAPATAPQILARCRELVRPALTVAVERMHPWPAEMAAFSFGWSEVGGAPVPGPGPGSRGKGVRQALTVLCAEAAGGRGEDAVVGAVAVELIHTFSLLHDDIMDGDETRRQRASVWKAYGTGPAVLAGDALFALAVETLAASRNVHSGAAVRHLAATLNDLVRGQADDLLFEARPWRGPGAVSPQEYRSMAGHKTGALLGCAAGLGAVLAGAPAATADVLAAAGRHLGVAFQAVDDLLGIWGDPRVTGKPVHSDLRRLKKTYPVIAALSTDSPAARQLVALLASGSPLDDAGARRAAGLVEEAGGRDATLAEARRHLDSARACLTSVPLAPAAVGDILTLLPFLVDRRM
ncbi:polyprenyl diphosphate synthase [Streptomyces agglomeratus]|uniref:Polyprenyl diphosphate synthase n=1 Tax=Streptomyces agglomeratus TaxID=285458 RepID=A0A1E5P2M4_9ACTN|nr:polyprenyl synthetase family protein [Streptomyces agglomeratus]OEJ23759.1 polyprenyl diphosphate synthase [Streptomyces agglomeratus]OEJ43353.1 polyprenyl diphosphate synthase [Streptomyces agglomeratus]OEJ54729.1 polyprenyl diphosphate synthase [Streptomyces agglomeratus]